MTSATGYGGMKGATGSNSGYKQFKEKIPSGYKAGAMQQYTPEQMQLHQSQFQHLGPDSFLSRLAGGDQSMFEEMEAPAMRQFQGLQGQLASRFSGMGMGARKSSGFQNTANQAASDFAQDLQSKRLGLRSQALKELMSMSNQVLSQKPYERFLVEKQQKQGTNWGGLVGAVGGGLVGLAGGPFGAIAGAQAGHAVGEAFM